MVFIRDTELVLRATVELVNTLPHTDTTGVDTLVSADQLDDFATRHAYTGSRTHDERELAAVRGIRSRIYELWTVDRDEAVPLVNAMLRDGKALPQLVRHDDFDWHIHASDPSDALAQRMLVEAAMAFVDVIRADEYARVRVCDADDCSGVYMNVNAYRRRKADQPA